MTSDAAMVPAGVIDRGSARSSAALDDAVRLLNTRILTAALVLTLIVTSFPIKNVQYVLPWLITVYVALAGRTVALARLILLSLMVAGVSVLAATLVLPDVNIAGVLWGVITYGTLLFWLSRPMSQLRTVDTARLTRRSADLVAAFVLVQSTLGLVQFAYSGNPDAVAGTFDPAAFLTGVVTISQVNLAVCLIGSLLFLFNFRHRVLHDLALLAGLICLFVSQSGHQLIAVVCAVGAAWGVGSFNIRRVLQVAGFGLVALLLALVLTPATVRRAPVWFEKIVVSEDSLKRQLWADSLEAVSVDPALAIGYGAGQYSSRAGLIASDEYLSIDLPSSLTGKSELFVTLVDPSLERFERVGEGSAIAKPYSSATSLLVEFGPVMAVGLLAAIMVAVVKLLAGARRLDPSAQRLRLSLAAGLVFLAVICLVENYVELVQAVFLPGLLFMLAHLAATPSSQTSRDHPVEPRS